MKSYLDVIFIVGLVVGLTAYTAWQRNDAVKSSSYTATVKKDQKLNIIREKKNEIRNSVYDNAVLVKRLRAGSW